LSDGVPYDELLSIAACWKEFLPTSWCNYQLVVGDPFGQAGMYVHQLVEREPFQKTGKYSSSLEGIPSGKLMYMPACWKGSLPKIW
jgi:hypothetical protein